MIWSRRRWTLTLGIAALSTALLLTSSNVEAGLVEFINISQSGQGPGDPPNPYGIPTILGDSLEFRGPAAFAATSFDGNFDIQDSFTDGFVSFSVEADDDTWITGFSLRERGGRTLLELPFPGTDTTRVRVIALGSISVTELDHGNTALTPDAALPIGIGFDVTWDLINNPGASLWSAFDAKNIENILTQRGVTFDHGATALDFFMNNQLLAISEEGTFAFIDKKRIDFDVSTEMLIPEPATIVLALMGIIGVFDSRQRVN